MPASDFDAFKMIELQAARARIEHMLPELAGMGQHRKLSDALSQLAQICSELGEGLPALAYRRKQLVEAQRLGDTALEAVVLLDTARAAAAVGEQWEAEQLFHAAADRYAGMGDMQGHGAALLAVAESRFSWGDTHGAVRAVEQAAPLIRGTAAWTDQAEHLHQLSATLRLVDDAGQVIARLRAGELDPLTLGSTITEHAGGLADGPRGLAQNITSMLGQLTNMPHPAALPPQPTAPEQAATDMRTVDELIAALQDTDQRQRRIAALALGLRRDAAAVEPLLAATRDRSQWVRLAAVVSLGKLKDRRAFDALAERLQHDRDKDVRRSAATALRLLKDARAAAALTIALTDEFAVAESAAKALRALKLTPRVDVLLDLLQTGTSADQRAQAALKLGEIGDASALLPLLAVAENSAETISLRITTLEAACALGDRRAAATAARILESHTPCSEVDLGTPETISELVCKACQIIARLGDDGMASLLLALLDDGNPFIRHAAIVALGAVADGRVIPRLQEIQQSDTASIPVEEPQHIGGITMAGMRLVALRSAAADAVRRIQRRAEQ